MDTTDAATLAAAWHNAVNSGDIDELLALSAPTIELLGPRGSAVGHAALRDWLARAGLSLAPQRIFVRDAAVVVAAHATWRAPETNEVVGEADVASCLRIANNQVVQYARYDTLAEALAAGSLTEMDEVAFDG